MMKKSGGDLHNLSTIWNYVECGICIIDMETRTILAINPIAARMFGDDASRLIGCLCHKLVCPAEKGACPIMDKGQTVDRSEREFVRADGSALPIIKSVAKIRYNGRPALLESFTDISNLKKAEEKLVRIESIERANKAKSDFLTRMSHEMRTPINAIIGMAQIANNAEDMEKLRYCLETIDGSASHLLRLINDVLDMAKIETGKLVLENLPFSIETLCKNICTLVARQAGEKNIALRASCDANMAGARFTGDAMRLSQVVINLMTNAVKFTPKGGSVTLAVKSAPLAAGGHMVQFSITDTGIGMNAKQISKLFNAFEQTDSSIPRRFGGTGLGLAIAKSIVKKMGGSIRVKSVPGKGSLFTARVKLRLDKTAAPPARLPAWKVLVADGDASMRELFAFLPGRGVTSVDAAEDVPSALAHMNCGKEYDAVFVSWEMREDMLSAMAKRYPSETIRQKTIIAASFLQWSLADEAALAEIEHFVIKPVFPSEIVAALASLAAKKRSNVPAAGKKMMEYPDFSRLSVLLVEDAPLNREICAALLGPTGICIDTAENGLEALTRFKTKPSQYDCILMDVNMPVMNGHEATRNIRALPGEHAKKVPIIAMTSGVFPEDIENCLACGMNAHLAKPVDATALLEQIKTCCPAG